MVEEVIEKYIETFGIEVPEDIIEETIKMMTEQVFHSKRYECMANGVVFMPGDLEKYAEEIQIEAKKLVKTQLVLDYIIEKEAYEVTMGELEEEAAALAERQQVTIETVKDFLGEDLSAIKKDILTRKAIAFITA